MIRGFPFELSYYNSITPVTVADFHCDTYAQKYF